MTTIAVTGATGALGHLVIDALLERTDAGSIVAIARDTTKAASIAAKGVTVRHGDYNDPATLRSALDGVDRVLLISGNDLSGGRFAQHQAVIDAAVAAGVSRFAYTSVLGADHTSNPVAPDHVKTEEYLKASGLPAAVLRNGWYNENFLPTVDTAAQTGVVLTSAGDGRVASASRADFAAAAAVVLTADDVQPVYELSGDVAWTQEDLAAAVSEVLGTTVRVQAVSADEHRAALVAAGVPEGAAAFVVGVDAAIADGDLALAAGGLGELIGRPTTPILDTLRTAR